MRLERRFKGRNGKGRLRGRRRPIHKITPTGTRGLEQEVTWMSTYVPGFWSQQYQNLSNDRRTQINKKVDEAFRQQTGISRCLDPKTDRGFVNQWLRIRDEVMAEQSKQGATSTRKTGFGKFV